MNPLPLSVLVRFRLLQQPFVRGRALQEGFVELAVGGLASMMGWTAPLSRPADDRKITVRCPCAG
jgi:hypothetical protein